MNRLSHKIFLLFLPLIACIFLFGHGYFVAREHLMLAHINQASRLATTQVATDIGYFAERRLGEFDSISAQLQQCYQLELSTSAIAVANALSYSAGFSALFVSDLDGAVSQFSLSANPSNRYVLRQNLTGLHLLDQQSKSQLLQSVEKWQTERPLREQRFRELKLQLSQLNKRGEVNSLTSRNLTRELIKLNKFKHLPEPVVTLVDTETIAKLGLIYDGSSYFFSRPLLDCQYQLAGFYTVVLDRTILEDKLFNAKQSFLEQDLHAVDVVLVRNNDRQLITGHNYLAADLLQQFGLNSTTTPEMRPQLGGILTNQKVIINPAQTAFDQASQNRQQQSENSGVSVALFVAQAELTRLNQAIKQEVQLYISIAIVVFVGLFLIVSRYVAKPIVELRKQVRLLANGGYPKMTQTSRRDEIGELFNAFEKMTQTIRHKEQQLTKLAQYDPLTGIFNRRAVMDAVAGIETLSHHTTIVFMLDLDHFKAVNDQYGHAVGDNVLRSVTALIKRDIRHSDIFGRMGGEEFTVVLPETNLKTGLQIAERIRQSIESMLADSLPESAPNQPITISVGVSVWHGGSFSKALANADKCLYRAKHQGRNQVVYEHTEQHNQLPHH